MALVIAVAASLAALAVSIVVSWVAKPRVVKRHPWIAWAVAVVATVGVGLAAFLTTQRLSDPSLEISVELAPCATSGLAVDGEPSSNEEPETSDTIVGSAAIYVTVINAGPDAVDAALGNRVTATVHATEGGRVGAQVYNPARGSGCAPAGVRWFQPTVAIGGRGVGQDQLLAYGKADYFTLASRTREVLGFTFRCAAPGSYLLTLRLHPDYPSPAERIVLEEQPFWCPDSYVLLGDPADGHAAARQTFRWDGHRYVRTPRGP